MPTIFSHPAVPIAIGLGLGKKIISKRLVAVGAIASILPDLDVIAFSFGIPYDAPLGHRGFTHSLFFALLVAGIGACAYRWCQSSFSRTFWFLLVAMASHGMLDAFTNGGLGIAFFWPWVDDRYFAPWRMIQVSPIGIFFFSTRGLSVIISELKWVWLPCVLLGIVLAVFRIYYLERRIKQN